MVNRKIKVAGVSFSLESTFYYLNSLKELEDLMEKRQPMFESDTDFFMVKGFSVFRFLKPESAPRILKVESLTVNPDAYAVKVELTKDRLFDFARRESLFIFETSDSYVMPSSLYLFAKKESGGEK
ncbi:hypothetical protein MUP77_23830 [Candidatus Bathyarchaeota archaeon]|nr:hypothetical protein [Candidatus Bathyarchaeota archaeon]